MDLTPEQQSMRRVVSAASRLDNILICSPRHIDATWRAIVNMLPQAKRKQWYRAEQGFVDQFGIFLTRKEAWNIAVRQNQIIRDHYLCVGTLYSEHLY